VNCVQCQKTIPKARIEVLPDTTFCVGCSEQLSGDYDVLLLTENPAPQDLQTKELYGTVQVVRVRKPR